MTVRLVLEVPDETAANYFRKVVKDWCDGLDGWEYVGDADPPATVPNCHECGKPMAWNDALQMHVCLHIEN